MVVASASECQWQSCALHNNGPPKLAQPDSGVLADEHLLLLLVSLQPTMHIMVEV